jgi:hypothetical protein
VTLKLLMKLLFPSVSAVFWGVPSPMRPCTCNMY